MTTEFTTSKGTFIAVEVPEGSYKFTNILASNQIDFFTPVKSDFAGEIVAGDAVILPKGEYQIIGLSSEILKSEELSKSIVDIHEGLSYWDGPEDIFYVKYTDPLSAHCDPTDSFQSLLDHHKIGNALILKKVK